MRRLTMRMMVFLSNVFSTDSVMDCLRDDDGGAISDTHTQGWRRNGDSCGTRLRRRTALRQRVALFNQRNTAPVGRAASTLRLRFVQTQRRQAPVLLLGRLSFASDYGAAAGLFRRRRAPQQPELPRTPSFTPNSPFSRFDPLHHGCSTSQMFGAQRTQRHQS